MSWISQDLIGLVSIMSVTLAMVCASGPVIADSQVHSDTQAVDDLVSGTVRDYDNTPLANVGVFYFGTGSNIGNTLTDANGLYTFTLSADTYEFRASKIGYPAPDNQTITVPPSHTNVDFIFPQRYTIAGHIQDGLGASVPDALIAAFGTGVNNLSELSDPAGAYTLTVKADAYTVSVSKTGYNAPPAQNVNVPPSHLATDFVITQSNPSPSVTPSPTPTITITPEPTPAFTSTVPATKTALLPMVIRQYPVIVIPTSSPTQLPTPSNGNHAPVFPQPLAITVTTQSEFDGSGRLTSATTIITLTAALDADSDTLTYAWSASNGSIQNVSQDGLRGQWRRLITAGRIQGGKITVIVSDGHGGSATATLNFS